MSKLSLQIQNLCTTNEHKFKEKKNHNRIKQISTKNKNTSAKFSKETKWSIMIRDRQCIVCWKPITDIHHVYFWTQSNYWDNRNDVNQWVWLCRDCHNVVHWCEKWSWARQKCIDYLNTYYNQWLKINSIIVDDII